MMNRILKMLSAAAFMLLLAGQALSGMTAQAAELLMFKEDGCPWCMAFDREVGRIYDNTSEARIAPLKRVDIYAIPKEYRHVGTIIYRPTFVLLDDERHVIGRIEGYPGFDTFWERLDMLLDTLKEHEAKKAAQGKMSGSKPPAQEG